ncbi:hypothetical protein FRACYDRAFT_244778 [Fragilariopsis cylindrus CCMP1102]|uniref:Ankyrin n=1 Tax=Fragilariopsis cylindrus CCMP1102 TaxID=635003 RepID=A0A1E7F0L9_9STRA|nr:hypothetical protein FRACYDRAFT_244778 [Fragilariopsis cylindrus CCMP1102]|eukprot:OEU11659.1 hypothetical protein FRACYDRAFT_244778 [Fragilariopsis cylindrus CCMP1102]
MNDADIGTEDVQQQQQQAINLLKKMIVVLEQKETFPFRNRKKINVLIEEFLEKLEDDIHGMFFDNYIEADSDNYRGLDSERDTEEEVEIAVRFFPEVLTRYSENDEDGRQSVYYPIQLLAFTCREGGRAWQCNAKAVSFIPLLARLAIELGLFEEDERGGLLCLDVSEGDNVLYLLTLTGETIVENLEEKYRAIDDKCLQVLIQLRKLGLLKKEDIQRYGLLRNLCREKYFAEKRFRFLVEWDPNVLTQTDEDGILPIHCQAFSSSIQGFRSVFEAGIHYYPMKEGISLLFRKDDHDKTPFHLACGNFGHEKVMEIVEDTLVGHHHLNDDSDDDANGPYNIVDALITACIDENIHLDCVYFLLLREPDVLQKLLPSSSSSLSSSITTNATETIVTEINPKKRKRKDTKKNDHDGT